MSDAGTELRFSLDWELWVVEQLLFEARLDDLVSFLVDQGVPDETARAGVDAILGSEGFRRLRTRTEEATLAARLQRLQRDLLPGSLPCRPSIDADTLLAEHWIPSRPLKLTHAFAELPALAWTPQALAERFGEVPVQVNVARTEARTASEVEAHHQTLSLAALLERLEGPAGNDQYAVSRNGLLAQPGLRALWDDLTPLPSFLVAPTWPQGVSLWAGPEGTITPPHFDPHNVLLVQLVGHKRIRLAPRLQASLAGALDGYYLRGSLDSVFGEGILSVELGPGEALFVPAAWFHEVTALAPSLTLSFVSFPWPNHYHFLGPPGSADSRPTAG